VGTTLNGLGVLYMRKGDFAKAVPLLWRDVAITEARLGPEHAFVAPSLVNLASIHQQQGTYAEAEVLYRRALSIQERAQGPSHLAVGITLSRLGGLYVEDHTKDPAEAEALLRRALAIVEQAAGPNHPSVATSLTGLADLRERRHEDVESARLLQRALEIQERVLGPSHPDVVRSLERLAGIRQRQADYTGAVASLARAFDIRESHLGRNLPMGSDRQREGYLTLFANDTDHAINLHVRGVPASSAALDLAVTTLLRRKGRALDAASDSVAVLRRHAPGDQRVLFDRLAAARVQLAAVTLQGPVGASATAYRFNLSRLEESVDQLESELSAASAAFRAEAATITRAAVQSAMPAGAALIEYALYRPRGPTGLPQLPRYIAYVLTSGAASPGWVDLGDARTIDSAVAEWRQGLRNPQRRDAVPLGRTVDRLVMQPVRPLLGPATHLLISADGQLNLIPFAALADEQNRFLIEHSTITYLTSGRDLVRLQDARPRRTAPVVIAAPAFGDPAVVAGTASTGRQRVDTSQIFFGPLPGVGDEVRALRQLLPAATILTGEQATETAAARVAGPEILHVATHGFFLEAQGPRAASTDPPSTMAGTRLGRWAVAVDNPLLRSGLALVGANRGGRGSDDGILTALEVSSLDLWGTRLVVLSACDTGVGDVRVGQGVYGLRRALVLAGAESQLMTLWPVSDRSTRDLMVSYYRQITANAGRGEALRRAQLAVLKNARYAHPYYWASFIQSGAWSPLANRAQ
jgi:CHAT domain-containing protein/tetratricopeptide (TPR) repeat protein